MTGGYRLWKREVLEAIPLDQIRSNGYIFQVEMAYIATLLGFRIKEVPIYFAERKFGQSKMNLRIQVEAALRVWQLRSRYRNLSSRLLTFPIPVQFISIKHIHMLVAAITFKGGNNGQH